MLLKPAIVTLDKYFFQVLVRGGKFELFKN